MSKVLKVELSAPAKQRGLFQFGLLLISLLMLVFITAPVRANDAHSWDTHTIPYTITFLEDSDNQLDFYDLFYPPWKHSFKSLPEQTNFGVTNASFWFKVMVQAQSAPEHAIIEISDPKLDNVIFYTLEDGDWKENKTGDTLPYSKREIKHPKFLKKIELTENESQIVYFKVASDGPINVATKLWKPSEFHHFDSRNMVLSGTYFGALFGLIIFNLLIYIIIGGRSYWYYFCYLLFITLFILCLRGFVTAYVMPEYPAITDKLSFPFLYLAMIFGLLFIDEIITIAKIAPILHKIMNRVCMVLIVIGLLGTYLGNHFYALITPYISIGVIGLALYANIQGIKAKYKPAYYVGLAFLSHAPTATLYALGVTGVIARASWAESAFQLGVVVSALLLSLALAYRIRYTENTLATVREEGGKKRVAFSRQLIESRDEERQLLASELHDGLGQNLLAIKNKLSRAIDSSKPINNNIEDAHNIVKTTIDDVRRLSHKLHPHILDRLGLKEAVIAVVRDAFDVKKVKVKLLVDETEVPRRSQVALHLYRIVQEGVKNILTHGHSKYVNVEMFQLANTITLRIENLSEISSTTWMPATDIEQGFGLSSIRERVDLLDGQCIFLRNSSGGFRMEVTVPFLI